MKKLNILFTDLCDAPSKNTYVYFISFFANNESGTVPVYDKGFIVNLHAIEYNTDTVSVIPGFQEPLAKLRVLQEYQYQEVTP